MSRTASAAADISTVDEIEIRSPNVEASKVVFHSSAVTGRYMATSAPFGSLGSSFERRAAGHVWSGHVAKIMAAPTWSRIVPEVFDHDAPGR